MRERVLARSSLLYVWHSSLSSQMKRLILSAVAAACLSTYAPEALAQAKTKKAAKPAPAPDVPKLPPFNVVEASIPDMRKALETGRTTSHELVIQYLTRIA